MANRLSKITTRNGDHGETSLGSGRVVSKADGFMDVLGDVDELNSLIGCVLAQPVSDNVRECLVTIQHQLFNVGGELALDGKYTLITQQDVLWLDEQLQQFNTSLPELKEFILPAGSMAVAQCHVARAVCRRAERCWVRALSGLLVDQVSEDHASHPKSDPFPFLLQYLNRLSDTLFVLARIIAKEADIDEVYWQSERLSKALK